MKATNEEAKEVLAQLMQRALDGVDAAVDFSQQQIPIVIEQLLTWHFVESLVFGVILSALLPVWIYTLYRFRPGQQIDPEGKYYGNTKFNLFTDNDNDPDSRIIFVVFASVAVVFCFFGGISDLLSAAKIWLAPKLYLLEYGASLVK